MRLLWEVCQVPDFQGVMTEAHTRLLARVFRSPRGPRPERCPRTGSPPRCATSTGRTATWTTLLARIAAIRTWTYVSHRPSWLSDARHWQERTRAVEDRLSDALHERLTQQFVDRPAAVIARYDPSELVTVVTEDGEVLVQGLRAGRARGLPLRPRPRGARGLQGTAGGGESRPARVGSAIGSPPWGRT